MVEAFGVGAKVHLIPAHDNGNFHGSDPFVRYPSVSIMTGVIWRNAMRAASIAVSKQSDGVAAAIMGMGQSPFRPCGLQQVRLLCLVGRPVLGPPR